MQSFENTVAVAHIVCGECGGEMEVQQEIGSMTEWVKPDLPERCEHCGAEFVHENEDEGVE